LLQLWSSTKIDPLSIREHFRIFMSRAHANWSFSLRRILKELPLLIPNKLLLLIMLISLLSSCGYHTATKGGSQIPNLNTLAVPAFANQTTTYKVEQTLTSAVVKELLKRTNYKLVYREDGSADATLRGTVTGAAAYPQTYDPQTSRASSMIVAVNMKVTLVARDGRVLYDNPNYSFRDQYQISREINSFFEEETPALERLSRDFARSLVSDMLEAF
jgi:outer membrane lipopolysaccharide assembly protein LptE/RlpB